MTTNISNELPAEESVSEELVHAESASGESAATPADASLVSAEEAITGDEPDADDAAATTTASAQPLSADLLQRIVEGALLAAGKPLAVEDLAALFEDDERPTPQAIRDALTAIGLQSSNRGFELREVASGFRFQVVQEVAPWIARLWEEKPQKYSRALLETLALIAYRQPITRGDIEDIRGVAVATNIIKTLLERDWVRVVGHKDVPGRPAMYATTRRFLDYFNLKNLDELPALADLRDLDALSAQLSLEGADTVLPEQQEGEAAEAPAEDQAAESLSAADPSTEHQPTEDQPVESRVDESQANTAAIDDGDAAETPAETDFQSDAEEAVSTEAAADAEPLEPQPDAHQSED